MPDWAIYVICSVSAAVGVGLGLLLLPNGSSRSRMGRGRANRTQPQRSIQAPSYTNVNCDEATLILSDLFVVREQTSPSQLKANSKTLLSFLSKATPYGRRIFHDVVVSVSVLPGEQTAQCRERVESRATENLSEATTQRRGNHILIFTTRESIGSYDHEVTSKIIYSSDYNKTYELRISVLLLEDRKEQYAEEVAFILDSFKVI